MDMPSAAVSSSCGGSNGCNDSIADASNGVRTASLPIAAEMPAVCSDNPKQSTTHTHETKDGDAQGSTQCSTQGNARGSTQSNTRGNTESSTQFGRQGNAHGSSYSHSHSHDDLHCHGHGSSYSSEHRNEDEEEESHISDIFFAFNYYKTDSLAEVARMEENFSKLSEDDTKLLCEGVQSRIARIKEAIAVNQRFIDLLLQDNPREDFTETNEKRPPPTEGGKNCGASPTDGMQNAENENESLNEGERMDDKTGHRKRSTSSSNASSPAYRSHSHSHYNAHNNYSPNPVVLARNMTKVRGTLRQFVREWSEEGENERKTAFDPLLRALEKHLPIEPNKKPPRILCPGSGLGRLPFEVVRRGYACQGNEFSYFMLIGSNFMLNYLVKPRSCLIFPYCLNTSNRKKHSDHLKPIRVPDSSPSDYVSVGQDFSMCAGEFVEVYAEQIKKWDGILTCFFIDTAKNVIMYIRTIAKILRPGGLWANTGPLLYHYAETPNEMSIELSWEEVKTVVEKWFTILSEEWIPSYYTSNTDSMMQVHYTAVNITAIRNELEAEGISNSVHD